ncbi:hypothetical protein, partial [Shewanella chilikensis]|uniref:hypothetical protein n=1 Tax=Shewanella chilikensis TaxID=558541 RepID=UPI00399BB50A
SCIKKSDDMGSSDFDPFSEIVKRSVLTDRHYCLACHYPYVITEGFESVIGHSGSLVSLIGIVI